MAARILCGAGIRVLAFEPDTVTISNLHRQVLYSENHVGQPKAVVASALFPQTLQVITRPFLPARDMATVASAVLLEASDDGRLKWALAKHPCPGAHLIIAGALGLEGWVWTRPAGSPAQLGDVFGEEHQAMFERTCASAGILGPLVNWVGARAAREAQEALASPPGHTRFWRLNANDLSAKLTVLGQW